MTNRQKIWLRAGLTVIIALVLLLIGAIFVRQYASSAASFDLIIEMHHYDEDGQRVTENKYYHKEVFLTETDQFESSAVILSPRQCYNPGGKYLITLDTCYFKDNYGNSVELTPTLAKIMAHYEHFEHQTFAGGGNWIIQDGDDYYVLVYWNVNLTSPATLYSYDVENDRLLPESGFDAIGIESGEVVGFRLNRKRQNFLWMVKE